MGFILKLILIFFILSFLFRKVGGFFFRTLSGTNGPQQNGRNRQQSSQQNQQRKGGIHVDKKMASNDKEFKGGEYIDFEEIKD